MDQFRSGGGRLASLPFVKKTSNSIIQNNHEYVINY